MNKSLFSNSEDQKLKQEYFLNDSNGIQDFMTPRSDYST